MKVQQIIGADLSKKSIDLVCHHTKNHLKIDNTPAGFKRLLKWFSQQKMNIADMMIVMEHTGFCSYRFEQFLLHHSICFTKISALAIKRSMGLVRGKSDKIDAARIACYGFEKKDKLIANVPVDKDIQRLQMLQATRGRLVKQRTGLKCAVKEYRYIGMSQKDIIMESQLKLIKNFDNQIQKLEQEIKIVVEQQKSLNDNFNLLVSTKGVGKVLALATIVKTHNFKRFMDPRKFACFCGTAPFEYTSGTSIRGRTKVNHLADKQMKTLLDLSAKSAIQYDKELRLFYLKRLEKGKSKMSTINIVRNKILYRMFAVIKRQTPFIENYLQAA